MHIYENYIGDCASRSDIVLDSDKVGVPVNMEGLEMESVNSEASFWWAN